LPILGINEEHIIASATGQLVAARTANQPVLAGATRERIVASFASQEDGLRAWDTELFVGRRSDDTDHVPGRRLDIPGDLAGDHLDQGAALFPQPTDAITRGRLTPESRIHEAQRDVAHRADRTIGTGERARAEQEVLECTRGFDDSGATAVQSDGGNGPLGQRRELSGIGSTVLVGVLPDQQLAEPRIALIDDAIVVSIEGRSQALEVGRPGTTKSRERDFVDVVDLTVVIEIHGEQAVSGADPAGVFPEAVA